MVLGNVFLEVIRPAPGHHVGVPLDQGGFGIALEHAPLEAAVVELGALLSGSLTRDALLSC